MARESTNRKEDFRIERISLLVLVICFVVLVYLLAFRPF
jgi:hypothetical protein